QYIELYTNRSAGNAAGDNDDSNKAPRLHVTSAHLVFIANRPDERKPWAVFAGDVHAGQYIFVLDDATGQLKPERIIRILEQAYPGAYAPLTEAGTLIVDRSLVSCYAQIASHELAH